MLRGIVIQCLFFLLIADVGAQILPDSVYPEYFITHDRAEYIEKLVDLPCGIHSADSIPQILLKLEEFLRNYSPNSQYPDDFFALEASKQALKSVMEGGYGIGALLIDPDGKIIAANHNHQIQRHRSDLHGEMTLLSDFEDGEEAYKYMHGISFKPGFMVFSSAEPCPMCFIRLSVAGVNTRYCTPGPEDGMVSHTQCLPPSWRALASQYVVEKGNCSPVMQKMAHLLFYSFLLDNR